MPMKRKASRKAVPVLVQDEDYDQPAIEFLRVLAMGLDLVLKEAKVTDTKTRRKIVDEFCWGAAEFLDSQWLRTSDGRRHFPILCFSDRHPDERPTEVRMPERASFLFHESAVDVFDDVTNKGKGPYGVTIGELGDDEPIDLEAD
jgi:hypothetical protein